MTSDDVFERYREVFRDEAFAPVTAVSVAHTLRFAGFAAGLFCGQVALELAGLPAWVVWPIGIALAVLQGFAYQALQLIGHDCGHGAFSRNREVERWFGHLTSAAMLVNFANWRRSHTLHHANIQNIEKDEAFGPKVRKEGRLAGAVQKALRATMFVPFVGYAAQIALPFSDRLKTPGYPNYFWPSAERESWVSFGFVSVHVAFIGLWAVLLGPAFAFRALVLPLLTAWNVFLMYTFLNHTGPDIAWYPNRIWSFREAVHSTCNVSYGPVLDRFLLGVGTDHYVHHLQPRIPWYRLQLASATLGDAHPNNRVRRLGFARACLAYGHWVWMRVQHGYLTDETGPFTYPTTQLPTDASGTE